MNEYGLRLEQLLHYFDAKKQKRYHIQTFINLCNKVGDIVEEEVNSLISEAYNALNELSRDETMKPKSYMRSFAMLQKAVRKNLGFTAKDTLKNEAIGMGIAIGVAMGSPFIAINAAFVGIGLPIGLAIGAAIGEKREKEAVEKGLVY